jgi:hypothetical protein
MARAKDTPEQQDATLGGALPDPAGESLHEQFQAGVITYQEFVNLSTAPPEVDPPPE